MVCVYLCARIRMCTYVCSIRVLVKLLNTDTFKRNPPLGYQFSGASLRRLFFPVALGLCVLKEKVFALDTMLERSKG